MRRKDREMGFEFGLAVIDKSVYATIAVVDELGEPYAIPISTVRVGDKIYIHSAKAGRKVDLFTPNKPVTMVFVGEVNIPELYSAQELEVLATDESKGSLLARRVFTTEYESTIINGSIAVVSDEAERREALTALSLKYCKGKQELIPMAIRSGAPRTLIYRVDIKELTSKRKKYDDQGEEMKGSCVVAQL